MFLNYNFAYMCTGQWLLVTVVLINLTVAIGADTYIYIYIYIYTLKSISKSQMTSLCCMMFSPHNCWTNKHQCIMRCILAPPKASINWGFPTVYRKGLWICCMIICQSEGCCLQAVATGSREYRGKPGTASSTF